MRYFLGLLAMLIAAVVIVGVPIALHAPRVEGPPWPIPTTYYCLSIRF